MSTCRLVWARDRIYISGSVTILPFAAAVAEHFSEKTGQKMPWVEAVGTGGGIRLFCSGNHPQAPDIVMASRLMTEKECDLCLQNGVGPLAQVIIGYGGCVFIQSQSSIPLRLRIEDIVNALTHDSAVYWADVNPALPFVPIHILGPAYTSGTYESFREILSNNIGKNGNFTNFRSDEAYCELGDNQNILLQKVLQEPTSVGIVTFSFYEQNQNLVRAIPVEGILPTQGTLRQRLYPFTWSLFLYLKQKKIRVFPQILSYIEEFRSHHALGHYGYLVKKGLVPFVFYDEENESQNVDPLQGLPPFRHGH